MAGIIQIVLHYLLDDPLSPLLFSFKPRFQLRCFKVNIASLTVRIVFDKLQAYKFNTVITKGLQRSINATKFIVLFERPFGTKSDQILYKNEPRHDKTSKMSLCPGRVFAVRLMSS